MGKGDRFRRAHIRKINRERMQYCLNPMDNNSDNDNYNDNSNSNSMGMIDPIFEITSGWIVWLNIKKKPYYAIVNYLQKKNHIKNFDLCWRNKRLGPKRLVHLPSDVPIARMNATNYVMGVSKGRRTQMEPPHYEWVEYANRMERITFV